MVAKAPDDDPEATPPPSSCGVGNDIGNGNMAPSCTGKMLSASGEWLYDPKKGSIQFVFVPEHNGAGKTGTLPWYAQMSIQCHDVPRLMREGLHWTSANLIQEEGYVTDYDYKDKPLYRSNKTKFINTRVLFLADRQAPARWTSYLHVHATSLDIIRNFRLSDLCMNMVQSVTADTASSQRIYQFQACNQQENFNAIYDDMPMEGWWPWPRKGGQEIKEPEAKERETEKPEDGDFEMPCIPRYVRMHKPMAALTVITLLSIFGMYPSDFVLFLLERLCIGAFILAISLAVEFITFSDTSALALASDIRRLSTYLITDLLSP